MGSRFGEQSVPSSLCSEATAYSEATEILNFRINMILLGPSALLPMPVFIGNGHFSGQYLQHASTLHAERLLEHRRGCERYHDAVSYTAWKLQKRIKQDIGYKIWAVYHDCTTLYVTYWKLCYLLSTLARVLDTMSSAAGPS